MWPFSPFIRRQPRIDLANRGGIPIEEVVQVSEETARVVFRLKNNLLGLLPGNRGIMTLVAQGLPTFTDATLPVYLYDGKRTKALLYGPGQPMTAAEFTNGHHYLFCYNKSDNTVVLINAEATAAPTEPAGSDTPTA